MGLLAAGGGWEETVWAYELVRGLGSLIACVAILVGVLGFAWVLSGVRLRASDSPA